MLVSETTIDAILGYLETRDFEAEMADFAEKQPALLAYVFSEDFELLTSEERDYMLYLMLVIYQSVEKEVEDMPLITAEMLEDAEERNWALLENVTSKRFRERLDVFFDSYEEEDLLAFVEDALTDDEDDTVTKEGREPMFIALKSVIDVLMWHIDEA